MLSVTLSLDGATWADLRKFVALAKSLPASDEIDLDYNDNGELRGLVLIGIPTESIGGEG